MFSFVVKGNASMLNVNVRIHNYVNVTLVLKHFPKMNVTKSAHIVWESVLRYFISTGKGTRLL
jgi:hypothetical protein